MPDEARDRQNVALKFSSDCWRARLSKAEFLHHLLQHCREMCLCCCRLPLTNYLSEPCIHCMKLGLDVTSVEEGNMHGVLWQFSQTVVSACLVHRSLGMRQANKLKINTDCKVGGMA